MSRYPFYKSISRLMALLLAFTLIFACAPAARAEEGSCGANLSWSFSDGTLRITGSGDMTNYHGGGDAPWYGYRNSITRLELPDGLTSIGSHGFYGLSQLTSVDLPGGVRSIGDYAFTGCGKIEMLDLGSSLESIGAGAFYSCRSLVSLRLPDGLRSIGVDAFYDCSSLTSVVIPGSVTKVGSAAFAYCTSLIRAEMKSSLTKLPDWIFFGCEQLSTVILPDSVSEMGNAAFRECDSLYHVTYGGSTITKDELEDSISQDVPGFQITGNVTSDLPGESSSSTKEVEKSDGTVGVQNITVVDNNNSSVNSKVEYNTAEDKVTVSSSVTVTVENDDGWQEARDAVEEALENFNDSTYYEGIEAGSSEIIVYVKDTESISQEFIDGIAGKDVTVTFITQDGSKWQIKGTDLLEQGDSESYDLRYELTAASQELCEELGSQSCYMLKFLESGQINAKVMIRLSGTAALQNATLLQLDKERTHIQTTVVDTEGYAYFYLASVDKDTEYCIALNLPMAEAEESPIVPEELLPAYGDVVNYTPIQYEITGRTSSWGVNLGQVMGILAAVMGSMIVIVGVVMYVLNKRRLKSGYVPQWDDEED